MDLKPLSDNVVIKPIEEEEEERQTDAGIFIPDTADKESKPSRGEVVAVGPGKVDVNGNKIEMSVKVGDEVVFNEGYSPTKVELGGEEYIVVEENKIYGILE